MRKQLFLGAVTGLFIYLSFESYAAGTDTAEKYFEAGLQKYIKGDAGASIKVLEDAVKSDKDNARYKNFLIKVLVEKGSEFYLQKKTREAYPYFEKAKQYDPENKEAGDMYSVLRKELFPEGSASDNAFPETNIEKFSKMLAEFQKTQQQLIDKSFGDKEQTLKGVLSKSSEEHQQFLNYQTKREDDIKNIIKENKAAVIKNFNSAIIIFIFGIIVVAVVLVYFLFKRSAKRETSFLQHQEKILQDMVQNAEVNTNRMLGSSSPFELIEGSHPKNRVKGVKIIETELVEETDFEVAQRLLIPFLEDKDFEVRANAAKTLYKYNHEKALYILKGMGKSKNRFERLNSVFALGEIGDMESSKILLSLIEDRDYHIKRNVLKFLQKIIRTKKEIFEAELFEKISKKLTEIKIKEGWII
ncbi:MAG: HEAT repeat domain-containing protein [Candidatus Firestonebacteria bacterium]